MLRLVHNRQRLTLGQSTFLAGLAQFAVYGVLFVLHIAVSGGLGLPSGEVAALTLATPVITALGGWLLRGLATGTWDVPSPLPDPPAPTPITPPAPVTPPTPPPGGTA